MNIKDRIQEISKIDVGFDIYLAKKKLDKINSLLSDVENAFFKDVCSISRDDIINLLQLCFGISYEIGYTKQQLNSNIDVEIAQRILPIARLIFGKSSELIPYLSLNLNNSIHDKDLHKLLEMEILDIRKLLE